MIKDYYLKLGENFTMTSATSGSNNSSETSGKNPVCPTEPPVLTVGCKMLRSPSHESVTTDLSLFSVSSLASDAANSGSNKLRLVTFKSYSEAYLSRGPSPNPEIKIVSSRPPDIPEILWFEEENDLIKSCAALSSALGFQKSFSTSDISNLPSPDEASSHPPRSAVSELALGALQRSGYWIDHPRLDHASRSCSTWVAVGDVASTSQLPSPHGGQSTAPAPAASPAPPVFSAADLIRSVNKKVRQNYIRRRLLTTYKALERLSQSEFNLDRLEVEVASEAAGPNQSSKTTHLTVPGAPNLGQSFGSRIMKNRNFGGKHFPLTLNDVERDRGKPLSKYERNMMIFNWLHTLDDMAYEGGQ